MYVKYILEPPGLLFYRKVYRPDALGRPRVFLASPSSVTFAQLKPTDVLDTGDLLRLLGCSPATLYRYIYERGLTPTFRVGRDMLFTKRAVLTWKEGRSKPARSR